jgi:alkanesulfonate monooxygenase SsuD/methylene tetrahydromethanopterin reductase-like flavin-dependent oxidoreductase (luciferase family)
MVAGLERQPMKFSLFIELQISEPGPGRESEAFHQALEAAILADTLGYHCVWAVEHHGLYEYSHSSAPEVFLSFVAARTRRIRVGHGVTLLPSRYNHPIRVAERIATLDVLSNGRVNWGSGKSASPVEQAAFQVDRSTLHDEWLEALEIIPRMWKEPVFQYKGRFFDIPPTQIIPKPVQTPHPPMFAACSKPDSAALVGGLGLGALNFAIGSDDYLKEKVEQYRSAVAGARPNAWTATNSFACTPVTLVLPDDRKACAYGFRGARFFADALALYYWSGTRPLGPIAVDRGFFSDADLDAAMRLRNAPGSQVSVIAGDPVAARESVQRFVDIGVDELLLVMHAGTVPHELVMESIRTFADEVMPHFA